MELSFSDLISSAFWLSVGSVIGFMIALLFIGFAYWFSSFVRGLVD
ncbi:hypothetical protein [Plesiomonas shigelloides]|nr:hypothetical protein [Plesiomonas shigelloides]